MHEYSNTAQRVIDSDQECIENEVSDDNKVYRTGQDSERMNEQGKNNNDHSHTTRENRIIVTIC